MVAGRLELASGWIRSDASIRAALVQAATACDEEKQAIFQAKAARDAALGEVVDVRGRYKVLESEMQGLRDQLAKEACDRKEKEEEMKTRKAAAKDRDAKLDERHGRLDTLEQALEAKRVELDGKARVLAEDRVAFADLEERSCKALKMVYKGGLEKPLAGAKDGPA